MRSPRFGDAAEIHTIDEFHPAASYIAPHDEIQVPTTSAFGGSGDEADDGIMQARHPDGSGILKAFPASSGQQKRNMECSP